MDLISGHLVLGQLHFDVILREWSDGRISPPQGVTLHLVQCDTATFGLTE